MSLRRWSFAIIAALLFVSCSNEAEVTPTAAPPPVVDTPAPVAENEPTEAPSPTPVEVEPGDEEQAGAAFVEEVTVNVLESFPVQVQATVSGNLSDGCTFVEDVSVGRQGTIFQITVTADRDPDAVCTQALVPFSEVVSLDVEGLEAGTYSVRAGEASTTFTLEADNASPPPPSLEGATLQPGVAQAQAGQTVVLNGAGYPASTMVEIGIGPQQSEYEIIGSVETDAGGAFTTQVAVPNYVEPGEQWVFVAVVDGQEVIAPPTTIVGETAPDDGADESGVNEPVDGRFTRTYIYLIAVEDAGQSGEMIGCNDSVIPVITEIEPTVAPMTAAYEQLLAIDDEFYGQSGLYNALHQSDLQLQGINLVDREAMVALQGTLLLGGACDAPRVRAQLERTALQYSTVDAVSITVNGQPLESLLSSQ